MAVLNRFDELAELRSGSQPATGPDQAQAPSPRLEVLIPGTAFDRKLSIYDPSAAFSLVDELSHLSKRAIEGNIFFDPRFLVPAMPRLDDRKVHLLVVRDEARGKSRLRMLMPYSVERVGMLPRLSMIRTWSHPFGPNGTLLLDGDDPEGTLESFFKSIRRSEFALPDVFVLPNIRIDGPMAQHLQSVSRSLGMPVRIVNRYSRAAIDKQAGSPIQFPVLSARRQRELRRQRRRLSFYGDVTFEVAREPKAVRLALEEFLAVEASGWKGRSRSAMVIDRYRAAFARESVNSLAEDGRVRVFSLKAGWQTVASLVVFVDHGEAYAWKTAYDERFASTSPGQQVVAEATRHLLADPAVKRADSCTVPDHFVMNRFWRDRIEMGTLVVGLSETSHARVEAVAKAVATDLRSRNQLRKLRGRAKKVLRWD